MTSVLDVSAAARAAAAATANSGHSFLIRGIYDKESDPEFEAVVTFETADECARWVSSHTACTNPRYPQCRQLYTTLCDWEQVNSMLLRVIAEYRTKYGTRIPKPLQRSNRFLSDDSSSVLAAIRACLDRPFHQETNEESTLNTLRYLFFHMRCGIFVMIRRNKLVMFVPFVNKDYTNTWGGSMPIEEGMTVQEYSQHKAATVATVGGKKEEVYIADQNRWWANGNIICNVDSPQYWGDSYLPQLRDLLQTLCKEREVADCEFFINKRDFPQLKRNATEPYDFIYDADDVPLSRESYSSYAPIASFFVGPDFADVPLVTTDDWETATGRVYPPAGTDIRSAKNRKANDVAWADRVATAFFRGNSTGPGTDVSTNQRIKLARLSQEWKASSEYGASNAIDGTPFLDAGLVGWNLRDRKLQGSAMTHIKPHMLGVPTVDRVPMYLQSKYKYQLYVDGHCAAMRYASMMPLGSVILKVDSYTKAGEMWYFPLLVPYDWKSGSSNTPAGDHIPIKQDLSDLAEAIAWCKTHDAECERIANNSKALYERVVAREGQLDYMQLLVHEIASRFTPTASQAQSGDATGPVVQAQSARLAQLATAEAAVASGQGDSAAMSAVSMRYASECGAAPTMLASSLAAPPVPGVEDWFSCASTAYTSVRIGPSLPPVPVLPEHAKEGCVCPACVSKAELMAAAEEVQRRMREEAQTKAAEQAEAERRAMAARAAAIAKIHEEKAAALTAGAASAGTAGVAGAGNGGNAHTGSTTALKTANIEKIKAAAAARAQLARQKAAEREGAPAGAGGGNADGGRPSKLPRIA